MSEELKTGRSSALRFAEESAPEGSPGQKKRLRQKSSTAYLQTSERPRAGMFQPGTGQPEAYRPGASQPLTASMVPQTQSVNSDQAIRPDKTTRAQQKRSTAYLRSAEQARAGTPGPGGSQPVTATVAPQTTTFKPGKQVSNAALPTQETAPMPVKAPKRRYYDAAKGVTTARLRFTEAKKPARLTFNAAAAPVRFTRDKARKKLRENDGDNVGAAALHGTEDAGEVGAKYAHHKIQKHRTRAAKKKRGAARANISTPQFSSNPISRRMQKHKLRLSYMQGHAGRSAGGAAASNQVRGFTARVMEAVKNTGKAVIRKTGKAAAVILAIGGGMVTLMTSMVSCGGVAGGGMGGAAELGAYRAEVDEILAAEAAYCQMEADLQTQLDNYQEDHPEYDEYNFELDEIGHDPYVLISMVSSIHDGPWTLEEVRPTLEMLFAKQYILTEEIVEEETEPPSEPTPTEPAPTEPSPTEPPPHPRPPGPGPTPEPMSQDPETDDGSEDSTEPSTYTICNVKLQNFNLSHVPVYIMSESQLSHYSVYMASLGCRPELFPDSEYIGRYGTGSYMDFAIPTEALEDEVFAAMITEARKYLGYPYVWGGSSPSTSFDCSGYVSWVINHTIVDGSPYWGDIGRRGATGLYYLCTPTSTPHPGDLVFFEKTYVDTPDVICTHVGIYVGVDPESGHRMMIHCGDPISFADLSNSYWVEHFYGFGRMPDP
jgi:hypothetical protein